MTTIWYRRRYWRKQSERYCWSGWSPWLHGNPFGIDHLINAYPFCEFTDCPIKAQAITLEETNERIDTQADDSTGDH